MMSGAQNEPHGQPRQQPPQEVVTAILEALKGMRYGQVTIIVQDGHVIQIDRVEKRRLRDGS
jgi:hypothetical protein